MKNTKASTHESFAKLPYRRWSKEHLEQVRAFRVTGDAEVDARTFMHITGREAFVGIADNPNLPDTLLGLLREWRRQWARAAAEPDRDGLLADIERCELAVVEAILAEADGRPSSSRAN